MEHALQTLREITYETDSIAKKLSRKERVKIRRARQQAVSRLLDEMKEVLEQIAFNEQWFQMECSEDLIDACIYQRESLQARYRHLLMQARAMEIYNFPFAERNV